jgi:error-prone DNA polymerase
MIICQGKLTTVVPLENASMPGRVVAQWDKEDCNDMGMIKVDLLGLGMMAAMQDSLEICSARGRPVDLASIPKDDPATYDLMCRADTIGVFQIESRAQMATLPRMLPKEFYDVVVEVAIIRPGPIQGEMLHPYLERRAGRQKVDYYDPRLKEVLERTLGVPLFQEQLLRIAMVMADFTGGEAEELRRALSFHRSKEKMDKVCVKLRAGMERKGVKPAVVASITKAVQSFAVYGFPESHAISFALIAYASCWLKVHGVRVRPVSVLESGWLCHVGKAPASTRPGLTAEPQGKSSEGDEDDSVRLGLCFLKGVNAEEGRRIVAEREKQAFASLEDFQLRTALSASTLRVLAKSGALNGLAEHRRDAQWKVEVLRQPDDLFARVEDDTPLPLARMKDHERLHADFASTGLTTGPHPMALWRGRLPDIWRACDLLTAKTGTCLRIAGQVICRQRPGTAKGFVFLSLEDETGIANAIVTPQLFEQMRLMISEEPALIVEGILQNFENVIHIKARTIEPLHTTLPAQLSHDFH